MSEPKLQCSPELLNDIKSLLDPIINSIGTPEQEQAASQTITKCIDDAIAQTESAIGRAYSGKGIKTLLKDTNSFTSTFFQLATSTEDYIDALIEEACDSVISNNINNVIKVSQGNPKSPVEIPSFYKGNSVRTLSDYEYIDPPTNPRIMFEDIISIKTRTLFPLILSLFRYDLITLKSSKTPNKEGALSVVNTYVQRRNDLQIIIQGLKSIIPGITSSGNLHSSHLWSNLIKQDVLKKVGSKSNPALVLSSVGPASNHISLIDSFNPNKFIECINQS